MNADNNSKTESTEPLIHPTYEAAEWWCAVRGQCGCIAQWGGRGYIVLHLRDGEVWAFTSASRIVYLPNWGKVGK